MGFKFMVDGRGKPARSKAEKYLLKPQSSKNEGVAEFFGSPAANMTNTATWKLSKQQQQQNLLQRFKKNLTNQGQKAATVFAEH